LIAANTGPLVAGIRDGPDVAGVVAVVCAVLAGASVGARVGVLVAFGDGNGVRVEGTAASTGFLRGVMVLARGVALGATPLAA